MTYARRLREEDAPRQYRSERHNPEDGYLVAQQGSGKQNGLQDCETEGEEPGQLHERWDLVKRRVHEPQVITIVFWGSRRTKSNSLVTTPT